MSDGFVNNDQANGVGGKSEPSGTQAENTFQSNKVKQLVVLVRYKPKPAAPGLDTAGAAGMLESVTGAVEGAVSAAENAAASIPGLNMFIKEEKKDSSSEKEYTWFKDYSGWDSVFNKMKEGMKEMNPDNETEVFDFSSLDAEGRKADAKELLGKVKSKMSAWSKYTAYIHFIGVGQGGNVANECTDLLAKDSQFKSETKWCVRSVIYASTPLYKNLHLVNKESLRGKGGTFAFKNPYDLTQMAIECFENNEKLRKAIEDSNKNTLSLAVGKVKLRLIEMLAIILSGLSISGGDQSELNKFDKIKDGAKGMVDDSMGIVKKLIAEGASFADLGKLPEFSNITKGYDNIPNEVSDKLSGFIDGFLNKAKNQAKSANLSLGPADLAGILSCLCPIFDKITASMAVFSYESKTSADLARQILETAGITKVYAPAESSGTDLPVDENYTKKALDSASTPKPDKSAAYIKKIQDLIRKASEKQPDVNAMNSDQKVLLAEAISCMVQPMLASKAKLYQELLSKVPLNLPEYIQKLNADKLMAIPGGLLEKLSIAFPEDLTKSIKGTDGEVKRISDYFNKNNFDTQEDTLYFIYNSQNLALKKMYGPIANCLATVTGYTSYMKAKGFDNEVTLAENKYKQGTKEEKQNVMPAEEL